MSKDTETRRSVQFFSFATRQTTRVASPPEDASDPLPRLAISRDGRTMLYVQLDHAVSDIMMVEDFR